jgi:hypothetical protein
MQKSKINENQKDKIAVIVITTHGDIQVRENKKNKTYEPLTMNPIRDMEIISLNVVTPGVPNLAPSEIVETGINIIKEETQNFNNSTDKNDMIEIVERMKVRLIENDTQPEEVENEFKNRNPEYIEDEEVVAYRLHDDSMYSIHDYSLEIPLDKEFLRANIDVFDKPSNERYDWKITLLSDSNEPDLMNTLNPTITALRTSETKKDNSITYFSKIIEYLRKIGKKKVIIVDFSCSVIRRRLYGVSPAQERYARLVAIRHRKGGKTNRNKNKRRRNNNTRKHRN